MAHKLLSRDGAENLQAKYSMKLPTDIVAVGTPQGTKYRVVALMQNYSQSNDWHRCQGWLDDLSFYHD